MISIQSDHLIPWSRELRTEVEYARGPGDYSVLLGNKIGDPGHDPASWHLITGYSGPDIQEYRVKIYQVTRNFLPGTPIKYRAKLEMLPGTPILPDKVTQ